MVQRRKSWLPVGAFVVAAVIVAMASCGGSKNDGSGFQQSTGAASSSGASSGGASSGSTSGCGAGLCIGGDDAGLNPDALGGGAGNPPPHSSMNMTVDDCPGTSGLSASVVSSLESGGTVDSSMKWLYPYDGTVFPGGLLPPVLQWSAQSGGTPSGVYVHLKSSLFEYKGCFGATNPTQLPIPAMVWSEALGQSNGSNDPLTVQVTTVSGGRVSGPITEHWTIALGSLKGVIYYNTYTSPQVMNNGAVMQLKPGLPTPTPILAIAGTSPVGPCISCHSLSANGSMLAAQRHFYPGGLQSPGSMTFNLTTGLPNATNPTPLASDAMDDWGFSAVYPDGTMLLTAGEPADSTSVTALFPVANTNNPGMIGPKASTMYDTMTGATITFTGLAVEHAMMPMFSPDGTKIVFNDVDNNGGHGLVVQSYDKMTHTFSNATVIYKDSANYPGWPFFTPDSANVVFAMGPSSNFASIPPASFSGVGPVQAQASDVTTSNLYMVRLSSPGTAQALDLANGVKSGTSYLPFPGRDENLNFYPTGSPVSAGGYFWVFFTSRRQYGNVMVDTTNSNAVPDPVFHAETKKIWATAITIDGNGDTSHPAFLLPGQEEASGNIRAFAALAPCTAMGKACTSGVDCCGGYCTNGTCGMPPKCAADGDKCTTSADCCTQVPPLSCIGGFCGTIVPQ